MSNRSNYLNVEEQTNIANQVKYVILTAPFQETMFVEKGAIFGAGALLVSGFVFWRGAFRGYNLAKYGRRRLVTAVMPIFCSVQGALFHSMLVKTRLYDMFRKEDHLSFGLRSAVAHQPGLLFSFIFITGHTFMNSHDIGVIATPKRLFKEGSRDETIKIYLSKLKPYTKQIAITWVASSAFMFIIGLLEYQQSRTILAKFNRKTLGLRED